MRERRQRRHHASARAGIEVAAVARGAQLAAMNQRGITLWIGEERTPNSV